MLRHLDLFSGIGGFALAARMVGGYETVGFCEIEPYCQRGLRKHWPGVPVYEDVRFINGHILQWNGDWPVHVLTGGFPCQDISYAGKGAGIDGERSGLWACIPPLIRDLRPRAVLLENVAALLTRGLGRVLGDLDTIGYDAEWHCLPASYVGAWHRRDRIWILAYPRGSGGREGRAEEPVLRQPDLSRAVARGFAKWPGRSGLPASRFCRTTDGVPARMDRTLALGNAIVPQVAAIFLQAIKECA